MKKWYVNRQETGVIHRGKTVEQDKFIRLTEAQAKLHGDKLEKSGDPQAILDCAFPFEHSEWLDSDKADKTSKQERRANRREAKKSEADGLD